MPVVTPFNRIEAPVVLVPAGTLKTAPQITDVSFNPGELVGIELTIPNGHGGFTGIAIAQSQTPVIPFTAGQWIIGNGRVWEWPLVGFSNTGDFQVIAFNTDVFDHSFYLQFLVSDFPTAAGAAIALPPLDLAGIGGGGG